MSFARLYALCDRHYENEIVSICCVVGHMRVRQAVWAVWQQMCSVIDFMCCVIGLLCRGIGPMCSVDKRGGRRYV
jgi:hypothetical protein